MRTPVVAIWNELTPYRLHVMRRVEREIPGIRVTNVFTHSVANNSMPWRMEVDSDLDVRFDERIRVPHYEQYFHRHALALARSVEGVVDQVRPVVVLLHGHSDFTRLLLLRRLRKAGFPIVHASDANIFDERYGLSPRAAVRRMYLKWILSRMDGYLPMGTGGRAFYRYYGRGDLPSFAFPYEPDYATLQREDAAAVAEFSRANALPPGRRRFLYSGRLVDVKRVDLLIRAFAEVAGRLPDWDLVIAGDGPLRKEMEALSATAPPGRVRFLGFQQLESLRHAYRACDVLVHPSVREPWALVINEAVAAGMAVIVTDGTGAAVDLVRHRINGFLVRPGSREALAAAMAEFADAGRADGMRRASERMLDEWRQAADPVAGMRAMVEWFASDARARGSA